MKKLKYFVLALLVSMVALTGCSKKNSLSPSEAIKKAVSNIETVKNYKMNIDMAIGMSMGESMSFDINLAGDLIADVANGISYTKIGMNLLGQDVTTETYTDIKSEDGKMITYTKSSTDDEWSKTVSEYSEDATNFTKFLEKLEENNDIKELNADKNNYNYEVTISAEDFKQVASSVGSDSMDTISQLNGNIKMKISIDKKTGNYSKLYVDMKDLLVEAMKTSGAEGVKISKAEFTITISDYNNAGIVKIPNEALDAEEEQGLEEGHVINSFVSSDYDKLLECKQTGEGTTSEVTFGFKNNKYSKALEEIKYTFDTKEKADALYNELNSEDDDSKSVFAFDKEVEVTIYHDPEDDEKDYTYNDIKSMFEGMGYTCE